jgi:hypothetical protein
MTVPLEEQCVQSRWPEGDRAQRLGKNLYLVCDVSQSAPVGEKGGILTRPPVNAPVEDRHERLGLS